MFKKLIHGMPQQLRDRWRNMTNSVWNRISRGAAEMARMQSHRTIHRGHDFDHQHSHHNPTQHDSKK